MNTICNFGLLKEVPKTIDDMFKIADSFDMGCTDAIMFDDSEECLAYIDSLITVKCDADEVKPLFHAMQ